MSYYLCLEGFLFGSAVLTGSLIGTRPPRPWQQRLRAAWPWAAWLVLGLFMGLRSDFTTDHSTYVEHFLALRQCSWQQVLTRSTPAAQRMEMGYQLLCKAIGLFTGSGAAFMLVIAFLFVGLTLYGARALSADLAWFCLFFVHTGIYFLAFNMMRQALAAAVVFAANGFAVRRRWVPWLSVCLAAVTIHTTALFLAGAMLLLVLPVRPWALALTGAAGLAALLFADEAIGLVQRWFYAGYGPDGYGMTGAPVGSVAVQLAMCLFCWSCALAGHLRPDSPGARFALSGSFVYAITALLNLQVAQLGRLCYFTSGHLMALTAHAMPALGRSRCAAAVRLACGVLLVLYLYQWLYDTPYADYRFFWLSP